MTTKTQGKPDLHRASWTRGMIELGFMLGFASAKRGDVGGPNGADVVDWGVVNEIVYDLEIQNIPRGGRDFVQEALLAPTLRVGFLRHAAVQKTVEGRIQRLRVSHPDPELEPAFFYVCPHLAQQDGENVDAELAGIAANDPGHLGDNSQIRLCDACYAEYEALENGFAEMARLRHGQLASVPGAHSQEN